MFKKNWIIVIPTFLLLLQTFLSIFPKTQISNEEFWSYIKSLQFLLYSIISLSIILIFLINQKKLYSRAIIKLSKIDRLSIGFLDEKCAKLIEIYKKIDVDLRINIMEYKKAFIYFKWKTCFSWPEIKFFYCYLEPNYTYNMELDIDKDIVFEINQGLCGFAFKNGLSFANLDNEDSNEFNLDERQKELTKNVKFIVSIPMYEFDIDKNKLTNKKIGVVNFDTKSPIITQLLNSQREELLADIFHRIKETSKFFSKFY